MDVTAYVGNFCREFDYPEPATDVLIRTSRAILENSAAAEIFRRTGRDFLSGRLRNGPEVLDALQDAADLTEIHPYTVHLLFYIGLSFPLRERYRQKRIGMDIYRDSMLDLKWKMLECRQVYGIWGSFVAWWFDGFFRLTRFALGRLQYERLPFGREYKGTQGVLKSESPVLNMHIPSCGPLTHEACMDSFQKAYAFYRKDFPEGPIPYMCHSWLLFPEHVRMLPETSRIRHFLSYFEILEWQNEPEGSDLWRIFGRLYDGRPQELPRDTGLRQAYADWLTAGHLPGWGLGLFYFDGEHILKGGDEAVLKEAY